MIEPARVIVVDPPWGMRDNLPGKGRGARKHYQCMPIEDLEAFELPPLAEDCVMFLWWLSSMPREPLRLIDAWGFREHSQIIWRKMTCTGAKEHFGMGRIVRGAHEPCMIAVRGRPKVKSRSERSVFSAPVGRHSAKPGAFYSLVERLYDGPYVELFARKHRTGWICYGNELGGTDDTTDSNRDPSASSIRPGLVSARDADAPAAVAG